MSDQDKPVADKPAAEDKPADKPAAEDKPADKPASEPAAGGATPAGTDQYGRQLYSVTCASCGKPTQVPFKPAGNRPVYCRDCYMQQRQSRGQRR